MELCFENGWPPVLRKTCKTAYNRFYLGKNAGSRQDGDDGIWQLGGCGQYCRLVADKVDDQQGCGIVVVVFVVGKRVCMDNLHASDYVDVGGVGKIQLNVHQHTQAHQCSQYVNCPFSHRTAKIGEISRNSSDNFGFSSGFFYLCKN